MKKIYILLILSLLSIRGILAEDAEYPVAKVSFEDYKNLVKEVEAHRAKHLIDLTTFLKMSKQEDTIILDTRSTYRYNRIHLKGALHLNFSDFTQENLAKLIPTFETKILIYCNNNFEGNQRDFATKMVALPAPTTESLPTQFRAQEKPRMMALNIPTYLNLYGYGYQNVYELHEFVNVEDLRVTFEGSILEPKKVELLKPGS